MAAAKHDDAVPRSIEILIEISLYHLHLRRMWEQRSGVNSTWGRAASASRPTEKEAGSEMKSINTVAESSSSVDEARGASVGSLKDRNGEAYTWSRGSRALDRLARLIIPVLYVVVVAVMFAGK
jgi:hypothetical protein